MVLVPNAQAGTNFYTNNISKIAPYAAALPLAAECGLFVKFTDENYEFEIATQNGKVDGLITTGSLDCSDGVWNIAYNCNCNPFLVLTEDTTITRGAEVFVGVGGKATTSVPAGASFIIGYVFNKNIYFTKLKDGSEGKCFEFIFAKGNIPFSSTVLMSEQKNIKKEQKILK